MNEENILLPSRSKSTIYNSEDARKSCTSLHVGRSELVPNKWFWVFMPIHRKKNSSFVVESKI